MFKKKSLKFTYNKVSRDLRHVETLKARESSRFKRLSMIRSINDSLEKDMEATTKEKEFKVPEKKKPSRLEMLFKWKQEKQIKKEMEKQTKKKPFCVGAKKDVIENKALLNFTAQPNSSFNSSKFGKSKLITPTTSVQSSRIQNSKQSTPSLSTQSARLPSSKQATPGSTLQLSKNVTSKQTALPKSVSNLCRSNSTATLSRKFPAPVIDKAGSSLKYGSNLTRSNSTAAIPKKFPVSSSMINKVTSSKTAIQRAPLVNKTPNVSNYANTKSKNAPKPVNKVGITLPKVMSNVTATSRGISVQSKMPVSKMNKEFGSNPKLNQKETSQNKENVSLRRGYCFRTAISNSIREQAGTLLKTPIQGTPKKHLEKNSKNVEEKPSVKEISEQSVDNIPDITFNSDISIIKPPRTSFAPANFAFQPPEGLNNFVFDDEDYDVYQDLEKIKLQFMSRTSTPSKDSRKSSIQSSKDSLGSNNITEAVEKTPNISNSNDIHISGLSLESFHVKSDNKIANDTEDIQTCNELACDIITNIEIKDAEADIAANQEICKVLTSVSYAKIEAEADVAVKEEASEKKETISPVNIEAKAYDETISQQNKEELLYDVNRELNKAEIVQQTVNNEQQKNLFDEKQSVIDSDVTEIPKGDALEMNTSENQFNQFLKIEASNRTTEDKFLDDDDSLLDSIDLSKIQLMKLDDEETDEDDVASPQLLKFSERKSNGAIPKRVSMLKKLPVMNSIAESSETDASVSVNKSSKENQDYRSSPRRSKRLSNLISLDHSPMKSNTGSLNNTPRRSLRLMKLSDVSNLPVSPFQEKNVSNVNKRQSVRLIDLSTPEKAACEKFLGENFENLDPNDFLIDFESPTMPALPKSKKVSLLYSPEKRKSIRKSIRGDLISFSPV